MIHLKIIRFGFMAGFIFSAFYHTLGVINPAWTEPSPMERHLVFIAIGLISSLILFFNRARPLLILLLLVGQQLMSHGAYGYKVFIEQNRIDWASVIVLTTMPILAYYVLRLNLNSKPHLEASLGTH
jgi:glucan phosphoethanolaminetransferase (alkaline phosphatase superfamily)